MTNISNHVPTKETCLKMKELGFKQDTIFGYHKIEHFSGKEITYPVVFHELKEILEEENKPFVCAAPIATEIIEELPKQISPLENLEKYVLEFGFENNKYWVCYVNHQFEAGGMSYKWMPENESFVEALALMYIHLKENKLMGEG